MFEAFLENNIATVATVFLLIAYAKGAIDLFKAKKTDGTMIPFWILINIALFCLLVNAAYLFYLYGTYGYLAMESANFTLAFVMLIMTIRYRKGMK